LRHSFSPKFIVALDLERGGIEGHHFEHGCGSEAGSRNHFGHNRGSQAGSSGHFEHHCGAEAGSSGHFERHCGSEAGWSGQVEGHCSTEQARAAIPSATADPSERARAAAVAVETAKAS
jgi:hypothetical protein